MLTLWFKHPPTGEIHFAGPARYFRFAGNRLLAGPADVEIGCHCDGMWQIGDKHFVTLGTDAPATLHFEAQGSQCSAIHGPFDKVEIVNATIWQGQQGKGLLARFDERSQSWYSYADGKSWPAAVVSQAGPLRKD
jgi:hypothetical protein